MTKEDKDRILIVGILTLLVEACSMSFYAVPKAFRPAGLEARIVKAKELVVQLKENGR